MRISEDEVSQLIRAVEHYAAYLRATKRDDHEYLDLDELLKRQPPTPERAIPAAKPQRAITQQSHPQRRRK